MYFCRQEILSAHVPLENDEWMRLEMARLTQCTKIFPLEQKIDGKSSDKADEEDKEEQEDNEDENDEKRKAESNLKVAKSATYEEIIVQVSILYMDSFISLLKLYRFFCKIGDKLCV